MAGQTLRTTVLDDGTWTVTPAALTSGTYTVTVQVTDPAGNVTTTTQQPAVVLPAAATPTTAATATTPVLASTGAQVAGLTGLAAALVLAGILMRRIAPPRRPRNAVR